jgi:hypothetical protein
MMIRLPHRFLWSMHNLFGHPAAEVAHLLGLARLSRWIHDSTAPRSSE